MGVKKYLLAGSALLALTGAAAQAQTASEEPQSAQSTSTDESKAIVVTGSRLRQTTDTGASAPVAIISAESMAARGFSSASSAINEMPSMRPPVATNSGIGNNPGLSGQAGIGASYPNLFGLGAGRTLTLINGRRVISTSGGLGDDAVDANIIPLGLLKRLDVVQGGGATVYGSGAIAGVVNYVLRDDFTGIEVDAQGSQTSRNDYATGNIRLTAGTNALEGRANIAINLEYSKTGSILRNERESGMAGTFAVQNFTPGAGTNGIPAQLYISDYYVPVLSHQGTLVATPALFGVPSLLLVGGQTVRFNDAGTALVAFNPGTTVPSIPITVTGGDYDQKIANGRETAMIPAVERYVGNLIGHIDLTPDIRLSGEIGLSKVIGRLPNERDFLTQFANFLGGIPGLRNLTFTKDNAFLTPAVVAQLSAASPSFAAGAPLVLGKGDWNSLYRPGDGDIVNTTDTYRGVIALDGKFNWGERQWNWGLSYSHSESHMKIKGLYPIDSRLRKAIDAVRDTNGNIVCRVNADADPTNNDTACVPLNAFGTQNITDAARNYVLISSAAGNGGAASPSVNKQDDFLATIGGDLFDLPTGGVQVSATFEHRAESSSFTPLEGDRLGLVLSLIPVPPASGSYKTDELAGEINIPLLGKDVTLPFAQAIDLNASLRYINHSLAGKETVWGAGLRWKVVEGLRLRGSYSRNFRAPNLAQLLRPATSANGAVTNPCSPDQIGQGLQPATRAANCLALFQANPTFGTGTSAATGTVQTSSPGDSAATRLANFIRSQTATTVVTTAGNPNLNNELSTTKTFGFVFEPSFVPGLVISADRIDLQLRDAIVPFTPDQFAAACVDTALNSDSCATFSFDPTGQIVTAKSTAVNAGVYRLKADTFVINYSTPLDRLLGGGDKGTLSLGLQATHNRLQTQTIGTATTRNDNTPVLPDWTAKFDASYGIGKFRINYTLNYLSQVKINFTATAENAPDGNPFIAANTRHNISASYDFGVVRVRAGINNFTDKMPSYPTTYYGDIVGRSFFLGINSRF